MSAYYTHRPTQTLSGKGPVTFLTGTRGFHPQVWEHQWHPSVGLCALLPPQGEGRSPGGTRWGPERWGGVGSLCPAGETTHPPKKSV